WQPSSASLRKTKDLPTAIDPVRPTLSIVRWRKLAICATDLFATSPLAECSSSTLLRLVIRHRRAPEFFFPRCDRHLRDERRQPGCNRASQSHGCVSLLRGRNNFVPDL